ncbi:MAG: MBL fold metallo-hydrolase [Porticoccus sp.]|nr:MBL fold metallo-hydrolase [Porticoccus sp.]
MNVIRKSFLFFATIMVSACVLSDHHWADVKYQTIEVKKNIFVMMAEGGNIAVFIGEDGTFLIDDQFAPLTEKMLEKIKKVGGEEPKFLVNTHWHFDHTGGNENLGKAGTLIVAHDNVRKRLSVNNTIKAFNKEIPASPKQALPVVTFSTDTSFHLNNETIRAFHVHHAHTDGDSVVHFQNANVFHAGDIWFNGFYPFIDVEHGGSLEGVIAAATTIITMTSAKSVIIPGHGPVGTRTQLMEYRDMLVLVLDTLRIYKSQGKSVEEVIKAKPTKELDAIWGGGFLKPDQWIRIIYNGLEMPEQ